MSAPPVESAAAEALVARWLDLDPPARPAFLQAHVAAITDEVINLMKTRATEHLYVNGREALELARSILYAAELTGRPLHRGWGLMALGNAYRNLGQYEAAIVAYDQAQAICAAAGEPVEAARSQIGKVGALGYLARYDEALETAARAREVLLSHGEWLLAAVIQSNAGNACLRQGDYKRALALYDETKAAFARIGVTPTASDLVFGNELNRSIVLRHLDRYKEALASAGEALALAEQLDLPACIARAQDSLGLTYFFLGEYNRALDLFSRARQIFEQEEMPRDVLVVQLFEAECLLALNEMERAHALCRTVAGACEALGMWHEVALAHVYSARALRGLGRLPAALAELESAHQIFERHQNGAWLAAVDLERALLAIDLGDWALAWHTAVAAYGGYAALGLPIEQAQAALALARVCEERQLVARAEALYQEVRATSEQHGLGRLSAQACYGLARLAAGRGQATEARGLLAQAIDEVEQLRSRLALDLRISFLADKLDLYEFAVRLTLEQRSPEQAFELVERAKSRALVELLDEQGHVHLRPRQAGDAALVAEIERLREEQRWFQHRARRQPAYGESDAATEAQRAAWYAAAREREQRLSELLLQLQVRNARYAEDHALLSVQTSAPAPFLRPGTLLIEYFALGEDLWAFTVTREGGIRAIPLATGLPTVQRLLAALRLNLASTADDGTNRARTAQNARGLLHKLYQGLLAPLEPALRAARRLLIVPHGRLHYLPFHALFDGHAHLVERLPLGYLPSASLLRHLSRRGAHAPSHFVGLPLVLGYSDDGLLPFTVSEARTVATRLQGRSVVEEEATREVLTRQGARSPLLHLAAHGEFRPEAPLFSAIHLADGPLTALDIFNLEWQAELVTLSACESGLGAIRPGDELIGLSRACLHAGAAALLLSLWRVEDQSTATLMATFYDALLDGQTKAEALRKAQRTLLERPESAHPYFWAPFFLIGDAHRPLTWFPKEH